MKRRTMNEISSLLEIERMEKVRRDRLEKARSVHNQVEDHNQLLLRDISEQLFGDLVEKVVTSVGGPSKRRKDGRKMFPSCFSDLCDCVKMTLTGEEEEASYPSSWGTSIMDKTADGDESTAADDDDDGSEADVKIHITNDQDIEVEYQNGNKNDNKNGNKNKKDKKARWKKLFKRNKKCVDTCEC
jgi:hypothetical protein